MKGAEVLRNPIRPSHTNRTLAPLALMGARYLLTAVISHPAGQSPPTPTPAPLPLWFLPHVRVVGGLRRHTLVFVRCPLVDK